MKSITVSSKLIVAQACHLLVENIAAIFLTLYLWKVGSITTLLSFRLQELLLIPVVAVLTGYIADRVSPKASLLGGLLIFAVQLALVLWFQESVVKWVTLLAFLGGVSSVLRFLSLNIINQTAISEAETVNYFARMTIVSQVLRVIFPLISGALVFWWGYTPIFALGLVLLGIMMGIVVSTPLHFKPNPYLPLDIYKKWNREKTSLFLVNLLWGLEFGLLGPLLPIITTKLLRGEAGWGVFTAFLSLLAIGFAIIFSRSQLKQRAVAAIGIFAFLLSSSALFFAIDSQLISFSLFMIVLYLWQTAQNVGLRPIMANIISHDPNYHFLATEYYAFLEVPFMLGRVLVIALLLGIGPQLEDTLVLGLLFALLGFIPLYESKALSLSKQAQVK